MIVRFIAPVLALAIVAPATGAEETRTGAAILKEIDALKEARFLVEKREDRAYVESYIAEYNRIRDQRSELVLELLNVDPGNARLPDLLVQRWQHVYRERGADVLDEEIDEAVEKTGNADLLVEGAYVKAWITVSTTSDYEATIRNVHAFLALAPKGDERVGRLLLDASRRMPDPERRAAFEDRILRAHPKFAERLKAERRQREAVGKPFELEFTDAISGKTIRTADLKGKVVVIDFWATWCGPCVAQMPKLKKLYAEYKDQGVEFVGVSLDDAGEGLEKLKKFVADNEIEWPQYFEGKDWEESFAAAWGVSSIPRVFVVAPDGGLRSINAGDGLESTIHDLLARAKAGD